ncbi:hypothetical protein [Legionella erythra]|uniref:Uncharacterized protein n=1 Tax=Legionella erythra TaxID=448 RepID=A0A0W0TQA6_LEGER|nr:hypothetical protein [Legionella erythra]KTC97823.1 hypothetical protein Lery_1662 [Legionella erythra]
MDKRFGLPVSTTSMEFATARDHFHHQMLASGSQAKNEARQFFLKYLSHYRNSALKSYWFQNETS